MEVDEVSNISNFYAIFEVTEIYVEVLFYVWSSLCTSSCYKYGKAEMPCCGYFDNHLNLYLTIVIFY